MNKNSLLLVVCAFVLGVVLNQFVLNQNTVSSESAEKAPLYWVAPMDANFRRDGPGKSPMGMDLVPVYEEENQSAAMGTVSINSQIENQLGVTTAPVVKGALKRQLNVAGFLQYDDTSVQHYHSRTSGWVEKLYVFSVGDQVQKGQKLYDLYSPELVYAQEEFVAAVKTENHALLQSSRLKLDALGVSPKQIKQLEKTKTVKQNLSFYAQKTGYISHLNVREGMFIQPSIEVLASADLSSIWVIAEVFESQWAWIQKDFPVTMTVESIPNRRWQGKVDYIFPNVNASNRTLQVRIVFNNHDLLLKPNMFAQLTLDTKPLAHTLLVPSNAIIDTGNEQRVVLALGGGQYRSVKVTTGLQANGQTQVMAGLDEGQQVVTSAQFLIDSESNAAAELARMDMSEESLDRVWVLGTVKKVGKQSLTLRHEPVDKWHWPAMTMDLAVDSELDLSQLNSGDAIGFCLDEFANKRYVITHIEKEQASAMDHSQMNHEGMQHD
ncbi:efflux RND transporter periplasmic adaptor subunit [Oceaniserpentilla sp. 4NH20-0058]|uniref:efflux RND transporter periplasmic adaptor subunit n=1 Tax=Oceaniserpentilla sp. 4NH20-0058 TaxID=3127660 RepID=UPI003109FC1C